MSKIVNVLNSLKHEDFNILYDIYNYRCLNEEQILELELERNVDTNRKKIRDKIEEYINLGVIEPTFYGKDLPVYFLTTIGINALKNVFHLPSEILRINNNNDVSIKRGFYRASELKMVETYINHQKHLNDFVINFTKKVNKKHTFKYYDEKHISQYSSIRPDGLIQIMDLDLFIEIDLNTESRKQLVEKWKNYRAFLNSEEYQYRERKIIVLFVFYNTKNSEERKNIVKHSIAEILLDVLNNNFDFYIGTQEEILDKLFKKIIPRSINKDIALQEIETSLIHDHSFSTVSGTLFNLVLNDEYDLYIRKMNMKKNIVIINKVPQHFLLDDYTSGQLSVLSKITYFSKNNKIFQEKFKLPIKYIIVVQTEESIYNDLKLLNILGVENVYFTTIPRLKKMSFYEALFTIDYIGNLYHFTEPTLQNRVFEKGLN